MSSKTALSLIIISLALVYALAWPAFGEVSALLSEKGAYEEMLAKAQEIEDRKNALLSEFNQISASDVKKVETLIPSSLNFVKLVADIDAAASRQGISINRISSIDNSASVTSVAEAESSKGYKSATIDFEFSASFDQFNDFLNELERSLRIFDIKAVKVTVGEGGVDKYEISLDTYWAG